MMASRCLCPSGSLPARSAHAFRALTAAALALGGACGHRLTHADGQVDGRGVSVQPPPAPPLPELRALGVEDTNGEATSEHGEDSSGEGVAAGGRADATETFDLAELDLEEYELLWVEEQAQLRRRSCALALSALGVLAPQQQGGDDEEVGRRVLVAIRGEHGSDAFFYRDVSSDATLKSLPSDLRAWVAVPTNDVGLPWHYFWDTVSGRTSWNAPVDAVPLLRPFDSTDLAPREVFRRWGASTELAPLLHNANLCQPHLFHEAAKLEWRCSVDTVDGVILARSLNLSVEYCRHIHTQKPSAEILARLVDYSRDFTHAAPVMHNALSLAELLSHGVTESTNSKMWSFWDRLQTSIENIVYTLRHLSEDTSFGASLLLRTFRMMPEADARRRCGFTLLTLHNCSIAFVEPPITSSRLANYTGVPTDISSAILHFWAPTDTENMRYLADLCSDDAMRREPEGLALLMHSMWQGSCLPVPGVGAVMAETCCRVMRKFPDETFVEYATQISEVAACLKRCRAPYCLRADQQQVARRAEAVLIAAELVLERMSEEERAEALPAFWEICRVLRAQVPLGCGPLISLKAALRREEKRMWRPYGRST
mmetsp:Transcript_81891/g.236744  ORF Transcript_81891/g.236744 Transcript_81891/m.236744 type:complete len:599 (+) Transcript_81891:3-1799(+)